MKYELDTKDTAKGFTTVNISFTPEEVRALEETKDDFDYSGPSLWPLFVLFFGGLAVLFAALVLWG